MKATPRTSLRHPWPRRTRIGLAVALACGAAPAALALPTGEQVVSGQVAVGRPSAQSMVVQQGSPSAILNWNSFSIGAGEGVSFQQPSAASVILNRVVQPNPSEIAGRLSANGRVFLVNPGGVLFTRGASVDVGALVASTLDISNADFLAGRYRFAAPGPGTVVNQGALQAAERGTVALLGGQVSNEGTITARLGTVALASGNKVTLDFAGDGLTRIVVDEAAVGAQVRNSGMVIADGGQAVLSASAAEALAGTVVNQQGVVRAHSLVERNGRIVLDGGETGTTLVSGKLDASGLDAGRSGGEIQVLGHQVGLVDAAAVDGSGAAGGGTVLIGGDLRGQNPAVRNAQAAFVGKDVTVRADALVAGTGGKVIVWSDRATRVHGSISANGGAAGGDGGFVETSGAFLDVAGARVSASSPLGRGGEWLLDPNDISIVDAASEGSTAGVDITAPPPDLNFTANTTSATVLDTDIEAALNQGTSVTVAAGNSSAAELGNVTVSAGVSIDKTLGGDATLTLNALRNIQFGANAAIVSSSGRLNIDLNADSSGAAGVIPGVGTVSGGAVILGSGTQIATNGGRLRIYGQSDPAAGRATGLSVALGAGSVAALNPEGVAIDRAAINTCVGQECTATGGDVVIRGRGTATVTPLAALTAVAGGAGVDVQGATIATGSGALTVDGLGGRGGAGVVLREAAIGDGISFATRLATASGLLSIVGAGTDAGAGSTAASVPAGVASTGSILSTASGAVSVVGTGARRVRTDIGAGAEQTTGAEGVSLLGTRLESISGSVSIVGTGSVGGAGVVAADGTREGGTVPSEIVTSTGNLSISGTGSGSVGPSDISTTDPLGIAISGATIRSLQGSVTLSGTGGDIFNTFIDALINNTRTVTPSHGIFSTGNSISAGASIALSGAAGSPGTTGGDVTVVVPARDLASASDVWRSPGGSISVAAPNQGATFSASIIDVSDAGAVGGSVSIEGLVVGLESSVVLADGAAGGGSILVQATDGLFAGSDTSMSANALAAGSGGTIRLLTLPTAFEGEGGTDYATNRVYAQVSARGGPAGGNGGLIETSGVALDLRGIRVDASAPNGAAGTWLIDPVDVAITTGATVGGTLPDFTASALGANVQNTDLNAVLNTATNVTIRTGEAPTVGQPGDITISAPIAKTAGGDATLRLEALGNIDLQGQAVSSTAGRLDVVFVSDTEGNRIGGIQLAAGSAIGTNGGSVSLGGGFAGAAGGFRETNPLGLNESIRLTGTSVDTRSIANLAIGGNFTAVALYGATAGLPVSGTSAARFTDSRLLTASGNVLVVAATSGDGANANAGITMASAAPDPMIETTSGTITLTATSQGIFSRAVDLQSGEIRSASGAVTITGLDASAVGGTGVSIEGTTIATTAGGSVDIRGRGTATGLLVGGDCFGDCTPAHIVTAGVPGSIVLSGESTTGGAGLAIQGGAIVGGSATSGNTTSGNIVLRATNVGGGDAIQMESAGRSALIQTVGGVINLRPGGVDFSGPLTPADAVPIDLLGGSGNGFNLSQADMAALLPGAAAVVIGGSTHAGIIALFAPLTSSSDFTLQNTGAGSGGVAIVGALSAPGRTITLASAGTVTQSAPVAAQSLLVSGPGIGDFALTNPSNAVSVFAADPPASVHFVNSGALTIGPVTGTGFDTAGNAPQAIAGVDSVAVSSMVVRTLAGDLTLTRNVRTIGTGSTIDLVSAGIFDNAGSGTLTPGAGGTWRIWADTWVGETRGGLDPGNPRPNLYGCSYPGTCTSDVSLPAAGNHFIYRQRPTATVVAQDAARPFGLPNPPLGFTVTGLVNGDSPADAAAATLSTTATILSPVGTYPITGTSASAVGYVLDFVPATLSVLPNPVPQASAVIEYAQTLLYGRNIGMQNMCLATGPLLVSAAVDATDRLDREWSRVRQLPNLTNCVEVGERHGCKDF